MAMRTSATPLPLHRRPDQKSRVEAYLAPRALAGLDECKDGWCRLSAGGVRGWAPEGQVWGASETQQCRPPGSKTHP
jgi:SH3-like domain-containing protein